MYKVFINIWLSCLMVFSAQLTFAQTNDEVDGEVQDAEILIEKERKIELNNETKLYEFIKWQPERLNPEMKPVNFKQYLYDVANEPIQFEPAQAALGKEVKVYKHYAKAGFGNYASPLLNLSMTAGNGSDQMLGLQLKHESFASGAINDENSASAATEASLYGVWLTEEVALKSALNYRLEQNYYFGYPEGTVVDKNDIKHQGNFFNLDLSGSDADNDDLWDLQAGVNFKHYSDNFAASENTMVVGLTGNYNDHIFMDIDFALSAYQDTGIDESRSYVRLNPYYRLLVDQLTLDVGLSLSFQNDDLPELNSGKIFPYAKVSYPLGLNYLVFAKLDGGFTFNTLYDFATEVGVLNQSIGLANSETLSDLSGGIEGNPVDQLSVRAAVGFQTVKYLPIMVNNVIDQSRIDLTYEMENSKIFTFRGEAQYKISDDHYVSAGVNFYGYSSDGYDQIYHRPTSEIFLSGDHCLVPKLKAQWNFSLINGLVGQNLALADTDVSLGAIPKLDLNLHYQLNDQWGLFGSGENLLNRNYSRYLHYPQRGVQIKLGATFRL